MRAGYRYTLPLVCPACRGTGITARRLVYGMQHYAVDTNETGDLLLDPADVDLDRLGEKLVLACTCGHEWETSRRVAS